MKTKKIVTNNACFCSTTMLTSKIITEIIEILKLRGVQIAATKMFQVDLDKP